ncbi:DUF3696 domain-containing protein, partial [Moritella marina]|uniref:AAA family ATPase n=1 Tax=Moritella marina TaxID=90736 RepID=UPI00370427C4
VHLHPQAQSNLIGLLTSLSECGIQVIIETHSDHIVNGLRVYSKEKEIPAGHSTIYSITDEGQKRAVKNINVDSDGNLSDVDDGFFDQISKDLLRLF